MKVRKPFGVEGKGMLSEEQTICRLEHDGKSCRGALVRMPISRLEESFGHRKYQCGNCGASYKFGTKEECV